MRLLKTRRFLPLFITQFLGAFNDNLFKNALVMLVAFKIAEESSIAPEYLIIAAGGLFMLPYFLFSATAGQIADKHDRARLARITKIWEILVVGIGAIGFIGHHPLFLLLVLFGLGAQATFFGPIKYALLPQHLHEDELVLGNAMIEAATFLAILLGTICGGLLIMHEQGEGMIVASTLIVALLGYGASRFIPPAPAPMPNLTVRFNIVKATWDMVARDKKSQRVFRSILAISWFWLVGAVFLSQFPTLAKDVIGGNEAVVTLFLTMFSLGIGIGSFLSNALVKGKIDSRFVAPSALMMAVFMIDLVFVASGYHRGATDTLLGVSEFMQSGVNIRLLADLFLIAVCGGIYIVPLYAIVQHDSDPNYRAQTIATNNVMNALFMVLSAVITAAMVGAGYTVAHIVALMAAGNLIAATAIRKLRKR